MHISVDVGFFSRNAVIASCLLPGPFGIIPRTNGGTVQKGTVCIPPHSCMCLECTCDVRNFCSQRMTLLQYNNGKFLVAAAILAGGFGQNLSLLLSPDGFCNIKPHQVALAGIVWFSWNTLLLMLVIDAHGVCLKDQAGRSDGTIGDEPITFHWKKGILWLVLFGEFQSLPTCRVLNCWKPPEIRGLSRAHLHYSSTLHTMRFPTIPTPPGGMRVDACVDTTADCGNSW